MEVCTYSCLHMGDSTQPQQKSAGAGESSDFGAIRAGPSQTPTFLPFWIQKIHWCKRSDLKKQFQDMPSRWFQEAYFFRMGKEWLSIPIGMECSFLQEWSAHSIPIGMEWSHSIPIGMEWALHSYRSEHSIPIGMECHSLPILKKYAARLHTCSPIRYAD